MIKGRAFKFGDNVSTDHIAPSSYLSVFADNIPEFAKHAMEYADPTFVSRVRLGDFVVAGENFAIGSSREQAPLVLKEVGISAVLAQSVARIFFRNAINVGLPILLCDTNSISDGDRLEIDLEAGEVLDATNGIRVVFERLPQVMLDILNIGGLIPYVKRHGRFNL
jgi:3-isopropylmalate/(R)-2-methylmalate dehydratase small subunit